MERAMGIEPTSEAWEAYLKARKRTNRRKRPVLTVCTPTK